MIAVLGAVTQAQQSKGPAASLWEVLSRSGEWPWDTADRLGDGMDSVTWRKTRAWNREVESMLCVPFVRITL